MALAALWLGCSGRPAIEPGPAPGAPALRAPAPAIQHVWREGPRPDGPAAALVVIHGMGDRPAGILPLVVGAPVPLQALAPQARTPAGSGWSWFSGGAAGRDPEQLCAELRSAADALASDLVALDLSQGGARRVGVTGFSQGGMLAWMLALHHPESIDAALPIAGYLPAPCMPDGGPPASAPPIRAFHGEADDRLPVQNQREVVAALQEQGWDVSLQTYPGVKHHLNAQMQADLFAVLGALLPPAP